MTTLKDVKQFSRSPSHLLKRAAQYANLIYMGEVGKSGLTHRQYTVLLAVDNNDGKSQTELVKLTGIDRSTLADLVARLLAQGYLQRKRTKDDGYKARLERLSTPALLDQHGAASKRAKRAAQG